MNGGSPTTPATPNNTLNVELAYHDGAKLMISSDQPGFSGSWTFTNTKPVNFSHIETISPSTVTYNSAQSINATEGITTGSSVVATFTDPSNLPLTDYSAEINWGDGTNSAGTVTFDSTSGVYSVSGSHLYAEDGSDSIAVIVHRAGAPDVTLNATATVVEPPLVKLLPPGVVAPVGNEGTTINLTAGYFTHGGNTEAGSPPPGAVNPPPIDFSATIDWGDGTSSVGTVSLNGSQYSVAGSHVYLDEGSFAVTAAVTDRSGGVSLTLGTTATIREALLPGGVAGTADQRFISEVYSDLLHRPVDAAGLAYWTAQLGAGASRAQVVAGVENTDEYRQVEVDTLFETYLHRHADAGALAADGKFLAQGGGDEQLAAVIIGSDEYFMQRGGGTNDGFLNALFEDALNRPIDAGAKAAFEQFLAKGMTRAQVGEIVFSSHEYHADLAGQMYLDKFGRTADAGGQGYFANQLDHGATDEQILAVIMASDEYFAKTA